MSIAQTLRNNKIISKLYKSTPKIINDLIYSVFGLIKFIEYRKIRKNELVELTKFNTSENSVKNVIQNAKLKLLLEHAYRETAYYKQWFDENNLKPSDITLENLHVLPIIDKNEFLNVSSRLISKNSMQYKPRKQSSGGTTGTTLNFLMDEKNYYFKEAEVFSYWARHGFKLRNSRTVMFRAGVLFKTESNFIPQKPWRMDYGRNMLYLSSYYASDEYFAKYYEKLKQWKPDYMHLLPSAGFLFADYLHRKNLTIRFKMVFSASEMLFPAHKAMMEKVFKCSVLDHYGHGEPGIYAAGQCNHGNYHLEGYNTIVERLPDGSIVETCLNNFSLPFIRYKVGDKISKIGNPGECPCGLQTAFIGNIEGRESSFIYTADGRRISSIGFDQIFKDNNVIMGQIIQDVKKELIVKLVPNETFTDNNQEKLLGSLQERVGMDTLISVVFVKDIPKAPSGKYNLIVSNII